MSNTFGYLVRMDILHSLATTIKARVNYGIKNIYILG